MRANMASKFKKFSDALDRINVEKIFLQAVKETQELALDLNRVQMYELGIDSKGRPLGQYTKGTKKIKQRKGQRTDHITLRDTGNFQDRMFMDTKKIPVMIDSRDGKTDIIEERWPNALGLTPEFLAQYKEEVMKVFRRKIHEVIEAKKKILQ